MNATVPTSHDVIPVPTTIAPHCSHSDISFSVFRKQEVPRLVAITGTYSNKKAAVLR